MRGFATGESGTALLEECDLDDFFLSGRIIEEGYNASSAVCAAVRINCSNNVCGHLTYQARDVFRLIFATLTWRGLLRNRVLLVLHAPMMRSSL